MHKNVLKFKKLKEKQKKFFLSNENKFIYENKVLANSEKKKILCLNPFPNYSYTLLSCTFYFV